MQDLMIDIETLGNKPGSIIASIGAIEFDALTGAFGRELLVIVDLASAEALGLTMDASTIKWWMQQSDQARANTFRDGKHIASALLDLTQLVGNVEPARVWAHSPSFDLVLLESAYRKAALYCPWTYKQPRDTRTLFEIAGVKIENSGVHHDALDDARAQAKAVIEAYRKLGISETEQVRGTPGVFALLPLVEQLLMEGNFFSSAIEGSGAGFDFQEWEHKAREAIAQARERP